MKKGILLVVSLLLFGTATSSAQKLKVHTIGDSTMADYAENTTRTRGWGEMLQEFFTSEVRVINYARGGRSSRSFFEEGLWQKVKNNLTAGDYVFIQFAHNDEKEGGKDGADFRGTAPWTTYKSYLERYVDETRQLSGIPIFITPIIRRYFDEEGKITPKGCHDLGTADDDSTLNYVRVMKHVARQRNVRLIDLTSITKSFVENLGQEVTTRQLYVPTDGTHTQATGAFCFARLVAEELKRQDILANYVKEDVAIAFNPASLDFGTVYVGNKATLCFDLAGIKLLPVQGQLSIQAPKQMKLSFELNGDEHQQVVIPYSGGKLWNQTLYLHVIPTETMDFNGSLVLTNGNQAREIPLKVLCKEMKSKRVITKSHPELQLKGMEKTGDRFTIETGEWPADIDEAGSRYVEFIIRNGEKTCMLKELSFILKGDVCFRVAYAYGKDFYPRTDVGECQQSNPSLNKIAFPLHVTLKPEERLHIRLFPWSTTAGNKDFAIEEWKVQGIEIE